MTIGARIEERRKAAGIKSQSALARQAGMPQSTMSSLIKRPYRWSPYLPRLARELSTTVEYLVGDTDDPREGALPPLPPGPTVVTMEVMLPPEPVLVRMFETLLEGIDAEASRDEIALLLGQRLPIGLSQLRDLRPDKAMPARQLADAVADVATPYRPRQR